MMNLKDSFLNLSKTSTNQNPLIPAVRILVDKNLISSDGTANSNEMSYKLEPEFWIDILWHKCCILIWIFD